MSEHLPILLPYQKRWLADRSPVKVCEKSRRIGITWIEAADRALSAATAGRAGMDAWYIGYNREMALEFIETAAEWARRFNRAAGAIEQVAVNDERADILSYRIRFASGHKIVALSSRPSNLRGKAGCAVIDEAAFHDNLPELLKAALALTMWGGLVRVISTHNGAASPFNELVTDIRAGRKAYSLHRTTLDDAIHEGLYRKICEQRAIDWSEAAETGWREEILGFYHENADEELFCVPRASSGSYLSSVMIESCMQPGIPVFRLSQPSEFSSLPEEVRHSEILAWCEDNLAAPLAALDPTLATCFGEDFARSGDLTVIWPLQIAPNLTRITPFTVELRNIPFRNQEQILFYILDRLPYLLAGAMDARGNGQFLAETTAHRYGPRIIQVMLTEGWYRDNMPRYKAAFEDRKLVIPRDSAILGDHRNIVLEHGIAKISDHRASLDHNGRHGDSAMAGALAYFASRAEPITIAYTPIPLKAVRTFETLPMPFATPSYDHMTMRSARGY